MSYPALKTELKTGSFCLFSNKFDFVFKLNNDVLKKMKVSKFTLQEAYQEYSAMLLEFQKENLVLSSTQEQGLGFISVSLEKESKKRLSKTLSKFDIDKLVNKEDYHFTLFYDLNNPIVSPKEISRDTVFIATANDIQVLGQEDDKLTALAIVFDSPTLIERFEQLKELGFTHDYDEFLPHCTIKYRPNQKDIDLILSHKKDILAEIGTIVLKKEHWRQAIKYDG